MINKICTYTVFIFVFMCIHCFAGGSPQVTSATATLVDSGANVIVQWLAEEPVTKVIISVGAFRKVVDVDIRDNRRTPSGVGGEASEVVPVVHGGGSVVVQVEDEYRRKSDVVTVEITGQRQNQPSGYQQGGFQQGIASHGGVVQDDGWGKEKLDHPIQRLPELTVGQGARHGQDGTAVQDPAMGLPPQQGMMQQPPPVIMPPVSNPVMPPTPMPVQQNNPVVPSPTMNSGMQPQAPPPLDPNMIPPPLPPPPPMDPGMIPPPPPLPPPPM